MNRSDGLGKCCTTLRLADVHVCFWRYVGTVDDEDGRMADVAGSVRSYARIFARVPRGHGFDAESTHMFIYLCDRDIRIMQTNRFAIKRPNNLYGKVAFHNGTRRRNHVTPIRRSITDRKRPYMRRNYNIIINNQK